MPSSDPQTPIKSTQSAKMSIPGKSVDIFSENMGRLLLGRFRFAVLLVATGCLSMMLANILCLNFTILCMGEEQFHWQNFTLDLGFDVFEKVDFEAKKTSPKGSEAVDMSDGRSSLFDVEVPGFNLPNSGLNWQGLQLARHNPQLFIRLLKKVAVEAAELAAREVGQQLDSRNIDFSQFREGFNLSSFDSNVQNQLKEYLLQKANQTAELSAQLNISRWENVRIEHVQLHNISWDGRVQGRIKVVDRPADFYYSQGQKAALFGVIALGALLAIPAVSLGIDRFGCRKTFTVVGLVSAFCTALCPPAAALGFVPFLVVRLFLGVGFAACFPVIGAVTSAWAQLTENGLFNGALTSFIQLAPVITMPLSGIICATIGWPFAFYAHALITIVLIGLWWIIYRDTASEHRLVGSGEVRLIQQGKVVDGRSKHNTFPFKEICSEVSVWAIWVAAIGNMYSIQMMIMFSPIYIREVLHYAIVNVGFAAAVPTLLQFMVKMVAGISSDRINWDETLKVRLFNSVAFCGMAAFMLALAFTPPEHFRLALLFIILTVTVLGFNTGGFFKSATLIGRQYAYFIGAKIQALMCLAMLSVPSFVFAMTPNNTAAEWSLVFVAHACLLLLTNAIFCLIGSGKAAPFTKTSVASTPDAVPTKEAELLEQTKPIIAGHGQQEAGQRNGQPRSGQQQNGAGNFA